MKAWPRVVFALASSLLAGQAFAQGRTLGRVDPPQIGGGSQLTQPPAGGTPALPPPVVTISGNQASVTLTIQDVSVDVVLTFEQVSNLTADSLGISARLATPAELAARLPAGTNLPAAFPMVIAIEPPTARGLAFRGVATLDLHTHNLSFSSGTPLRLFKAPLGGAFADITAEMGTGSYRARGSSGGFSEFVIADDGRSIDTVVNAKLDDIDALLSAFGSTIPAGLLSQLQSLLDATRAAWLAGDARTAVTTITAFSDLVQTSSGPGAIPDQWRASRDLSDVAGLLRSAAGTLRLSLELAE